MELLGSDTSGIVLESRKCGEGYGDKLIGEGGYVGINDNLRDL